MEKALKIGTRSSKLALIQVELLIHALKEKHPHIILELVEIITSSDRIQDRALSEVGGKGLFTKEIEDQLLDGRIDCAVHSMKDMPTVLPKGLSIPCLLKRGDVRDAFLSLKANSIQELPEGSVVGTASLRRGAIIRSIRPDLKVEVFRGNVDTRIQKLSDGVVDATLLAVAGLERMEKLDLAQEILEPEVMLPAVAQGAIGIEIRENDKKMLDLLSTVHCPTTELQVTAERAFLNIMDGSCKTPIAALMNKPDKEGNTILNVLIAKPDGNDILKGSYAAKITNVTEAIELGQRAGKDLKAKMPKDFLNCSI